MKNIKYTCDFCGSVHDKELPKTQFGAYKDDGSGSGFNSGADICEECLHTIFEAIKKATKEIEITDGVGPDEPPLLIVQSLDTPKGFVLRAINKAEYAGWTYGWSSPTKDHPFCGWVRLERKHS